METNHVSKNPNPSTPPTLDLSMLRRFFEKSFAHPDAKKLGFEYEASGVWNENLQPIDFVGERSVTTILQHFADKYGQDAATQEDGRILGIELPYGRITLEPGAQIEFSSHPIASLHTLRQQLTDYIHDLYAIGQHENITFYAAGVDPFNPQSLRPWNPKTRYRIMRSFLGKRGKHAHRMMQQTMSIQYNIDFSSEADALQKYHAAIALYPTFQFLSSNSRIYEGKLLDFSMRKEIWAHTDPDRSGIPPHIQSFDDYIDYALDVPMFFIKRDDQPIELPYPWTFRTFLQQGYQGHTPEYSDWELHLSTLFPEVRFKKNALELRMFDGNSPAFTEAMAAVIKGIFYHEPSLEAIAQHTWGEDWESAETLLKLAQSGLERDEQAFLAPLATQVQERILPGERSVEIFTHQNEPNALLQHLAIKPYNP